jgi:hypothetical protein
MKQRELELAEQALQERVDKVCLNIYIYIYIYPVCVCVCVCVYMYTDVYDKVYLLHTYKIHVHANICLLHV